MRYFVSSDLHSFYNEYISALNDAGFDINNPEHCLIICGDIFDRGNQSQEIYDFLKSIPKDRRILLRGNHEYLLKDLVKKSYPQSYDFTNGTVKTIRDLTKVDDWMIYMDWETVVRKFRKLEIIKWINSDEWVNYFELGPFIFVHCFIPLKITNDAHPSEINYAEFKKIKDWRNKATKKDWENATWNCPFRLINKGMFDDELKQNKILVCGHWSTSDFREFYNQPNENNFDIFVGKNIIGLDATTALSRQCNVLVIDEDFNCYDSKGNKLNL